MGARVRVSVVMARECAAWVRGGGVRRRELGGQSARMRAFARARSFSTCAFLGAVDASDCTDDRTFDLCCADYNRRK
jgi:hypothetical protein